MPATRAHQRWRQTGLLAADPAALRNRESQHAADCGATFAENGIAGYGLLGRYHEARQDITIRGQNMSDARARESTAVAASNAAGGKVAELRKRVQPLPQVKSYGECSRCSSRRERRSAMTHGRCRSESDLAAAKIMDPNLLCANRKRRWS